VPDDVRSNIFFAAVRPSEVTSETIPAVAEGMFRIRSIYSDMRVKHVFLEAFTAQPPTFTPY
jgi:hypothetical protein